MNRAVRRRQERDRNRGKPTLIVSDNMLAMPLGEHFAPHQRMAQLPMKAPGRHRWVAVASFVVNTPERLIGDEDTLKILGPRTLMSLGIGCWDCEQPWSTTLDPVCPAEGDDA